MKQCVRHLADGHSGIAYLVRSGSPSLFLCSFVLYPKPTMRLLRWRSPAGP